METIVKDLIKESIENGQLKSKFTYQHFEKLTTSLAVDMTHGQFIKDRGVLKGCRDIDYLTEDEIGLKILYENKVYELLLDGNNYQEIKNILISNKKVDVKGN